MSPVRRSRVVRATLAVALTPLFAGCSGSAGSSPDADSPSGSGEPSLELRVVDPATLVVPRAPFCDGVPQDAAASALGAEPADVSVYRSGQRIKISDDVADVVHEFGCRWTAGDGTAEAWVFAPPVTRERAKQLADQGRCGPGGAKDLFGRPGSRCTSRTDGAVTVRYQGLYGDAWLACSLTLTGEAEQVVEERAGLWCANVESGAASAG